MATAIAEVPEIQSAGRSTESARSLLFPLFFVSGFAALLYQIVWQRSLFAIYGINVQSVTVVVSAFMLGLGLGGLLGGYISQTKVPALLAFGSAELGIAVFGFLSLRIFNAVAVYTAGVSTLATGILAFALVLVPTLLMGMTLPVLVEYCVRTIPNVGRWTSSLYCVNTLGSAVGCFVAGIFLLSWLGQSGAVRFAACINAVVGIIALLCYMRLRSSEPAAVFEASTGSPLAQAIPFALGIILAGFSGVIALAYEIIWYRIFAFSAASKAPTFAFVLGMYLNGIAFGAILAERISCSERTPAEQRRLTGCLIVIGNILAFALAPAASYVVHAAQWPFVALLLLPFGALFLGAIFPLACQLSVRPDENAGSRLGKLYFVNIIGSTLGSFVIGYLLMDFMSTAQVSLLLVCGGTLLGLALLTWRDAQQWKRAAALALVTAVVVGGLWPTFSRMYRRLLPGYEKAGDFEYVIENRSGVVGVLANRTVIGGGAYDGKFNTDPVQDTNGIFRAYALSAIHPRPRNVLMIGLASGSWAQVIANNPQVEHLTIVEINRGYLALIPRYDEVRSVLSNPKVTITIDDGRRWLRRNPNLRFDAIVMNTTWHWRASATNLQSLEFLKLLRHHLNPGGVGYYNTTESPEVQVTAARTFPYSLRIFTFMVVSDSPINLDKDRWLATMRQYSIDGKPVLLAGNPPSEALLQKYSRWVGEAHGNSPLQFIEYSDTILRRYKDRRTVTDDNMASEWSD